MTDEKIAEILRLVKLGFWPDRAATAAGVDAATMRSHRKRHPEFATSLEEAEAVAESLMHSRVLKHSEKNWQAAQWLMKSRWPSRWNRESDAVERIADAMESGPTAPDAGAPLADYLGKLASIAAAVGVTTTKKG